MKSKQTAEKNELSFKIDDLQAKLNRADSKLKEIKKYHEKVCKLLQAKSQNRNNYMIFFFRTKKKKKQYQAYAKALKLKSDTINSKIRELQLREQSVGQMVPAQAYNKLKAHLNLLVKKHQAFKNMIINSGNFSESGQKQQNQLLNIFDINFEKGNLPPTSSSINKPDLDLMGGVEPISKNQGLFPNFNGSSTRNDLVC